MSSLILKQTEIKGWHKNKIYIENIFDMYLCVN